MRRRPPPLGLPLADRGGRPRRRPGRRALPGGAARHAGAGADPPAGRLRKLTWLGLVERRTLGEAAALHATSDLEACEAARLAGRIGLSLPPVGRGARTASRTSRRPRATTLLAPSVRAALARRPLLLFLGRVSWKKGLDRLIRALPRILPRVPGATLAIAGNDDEGLRPALERLAAEIGVADRVLFLGDGPRRRQGRPPPRRRRPRPLLLLGELRQRRARGDGGRLPGRRHPRGGPRRRGPRDRRRHRRRGRSRVRWATALADLLGRPRGAAGDGPSAAAAAARERFGWGVVAATWKPSTTSSWPGDRRGLTAFRLAARSPRSSRPVEDRMRITFLVERPTQFEAPFYRFAARDRRRARAAGALHRPRRGGAGLRPRARPRPVDWGIDLLGGYPHAICPARGRARFLAARARGRAAATC